MSLTRTDFAAFFAALHGGHVPFAWQERLLDTVLGQGRWPDQIVAPTGSGKTAVIDVHVFAQALTALGEGLRLPRRLSLVVGRRALVDDQQEYTRDLAQQLIDPSDPLLQEVAARLWALRRPGAVEPAGGAADDGTVPEPSPLITGRLRGGQIPSRAWRDYPTAAAVLCATPEMWGSRLLFGGYGSSSLALPREAGLLAFDSVVVVDEAHLSRQLLCTARRVRELAVVAESSVGAPHLQVVETTATPAESAGDAARVSVGVEPADLVDGGTLSDRLTRPKQVTILPLDDWTGLREPQRRKLASALADAVTGVLDQGDMTAETGLPDQPAHTVGCFVNSVARAVDVAAELRGRAVDGRLLRVVVICGQVRPHDLDRLRAEYPGLLTPNGNREVDVIVATQSLEVGVDLDLAAMVTELASGTALAQRAGRVNRRGLRAGGPITVTVPAEAITEKTRSGPYDDQELHSALIWLRDCARSDAGMAPWNLRSLTPPPAEPRRALFQRPELADAWHWARTSDDLAAQADLDLWLADDFEPDNAIGLVVRDAMPVDTTDAIQLLTDLPPRPHEVFPVPYRNALTALTRWGLTRAERSEHQPDGIPAAVVLRADTPGILQWKDEAGTVLLEAAPPMRPDDGVRPAIRPGDMVVIDSSAAIFTSSSASSANGGAGFSPPVVLAGDGEGVRPDRHRAPDVLTAQAGLSAAAWQSRQVGGVVLRIDKTVFSPSEAAFTGLAKELSVIGDYESDAEDPDDPRSSSQMRRQTLAQWLADHQLVHPLSMAGAAYELLTSKESDRCELSIRYGPLLSDTRKSVGGDDAPLPVRVVLRDRRRAGFDEELRQVWTPARKAVSLEQHQSAVAARAAVQAGHLGLQVELVDALRLAGAHHDDGKQDNRFQVRLGRRSGDPVLAKSRKGSSPEQARRNEGRSGLPARWRHEQVSVVESWDAVRVDGVDPQLVARLIGTSHGHGRTGFPHTAAELLTAANPVRSMQIAKDLFDDGLWDELIEKTQQQYGVWGCAFLEALLRAADGQVSEEGS